MVVAIRGAITVEKNEKEAILTASAKLIEAVMQRNNLTEDNLISIIFTVTQDLDQAFPATAARNLGLTNTPLLDAMEIPVPNSLPMCIRLLAHCETNMSKSQVKHVYLEGAAALRTDLAKDE